MKTYSAILSLIFYIYVLDRQKNMLGTPKTCFSSETKRNQLWIETKLCDIEKLEQLKL